MSRATDYLERIGAADRVDPSLQDTIIAFRRKEERRLTSLDNP